MSANICGTVIDKARLVLNMPSSKFAICARYCCQSRLRRPSSVSLKHKQLCRAENKLRPQSRISTQIWDHGQVHTSSPLYITKSTMSAFWESRICTYLTARNSEKWLLYFSRRSSLQKVRCASVHQEPVPTLRTATSFTQHNHTQKQIHPVH